VAAASWKGGSRQEATVKLILFVCNFQTHRTQRWLGGSGAVGGAIQRTDNWLTFFATRAAAMGASRQPDWDQLLLSSENLVQQVRGMQAHRCFDGV
jgi:hypothetical protein